VQTQDFDALENQRTHLTAALEDGNTRVREAKEAVDVEKRNREAAEIAFAEEVLSQCVYLWFANELLMVSSEPGSKKKRKAGDRNTMICWGDIGCLLRRASWRGNTSSWSRRKRRRLSKRYGSAHTLAL